MPNLPRRSAAAEHYFEVTAVNSVNIGPASDVARVINNKFCHLSRCRDSSIWHGSISFFPSFFFFSFLHSRMILKTKGIAFYVVTKYSYMSHKGE